MTINDLIAELEMAPDKDRQVDICLQVCGEASQILAVTELHAGRENHSLYICADDPNWGDD